MFGTLEKRPGLEMLMVIEKAGAHRSRTRRDESGPEPRGRAEPDAQIEEEMPSFQRHFAK